MLRCHDRCRSLVHCSVWTVDLPRLWFIAGLFGVACWQPRLTYCYAGLQSPGPQSADSWTCPSIITTACDTANCRRGPTRRLAMCQGLVTDMITVGVYVVHVGILYLDTYYSSAVVLMFVMFTLTSFSQCASDVITVSLLVVCVLYRLLITELLLCLFDVINAQFVNICSTDSAIRRYINDAR